MQIKNIEANEDAMYAVKSLDRLVNFTLSFKKFLDKLKAKLEKDSQKTEFDTTHYGNLKPIVDTFFLKFESKIVKIKGRKKVEIDNQGFVIRD